MTWLGHWAPKSVYWHPWPVWPCRRFYQSLARFPLKLGALRNLSICKSSLIIARHSLLSLSKLSLHLISSDLSNCGFSGSIPTQLGLLTQLNSLYCASFFSFLFFSFLSFLDRQRDHFFSFFSGHCNVMDWLVLFQPVLITTFPSSPNLIWTAETTSVPWRTTPPGATRPIILGPLSATPVLVTPVRMVAPVLVVLASSLNVSAHPRTPEPTAKCPWTSAWLILLPVCTVRAFPAHTMLCASATPDIMARPARAVRFWPFLSFSFTLLLFFFFFSSFFFFFLFLLFFSFFSFSFIIFIIFLIFVIFIIFIIFIMLI